MRGEMSNYSVSRVRSISLTPHGNPGVKVQLRVVPPEAGSWASTLLHLSVTVKGIKPQMLWDLFWRESGA